MENLPRQKSDLEKKIDKIHDEIHKILNLKVEDHKEEDDLNSKILSLTMKIRDQYPELYKYIEEMQETIPDKKNPEISSRNLKVYYDSLNSMLSKYLLEH